MRNLQVEFKEKNNTMLSLALSGDLTAVSAIQFRQDLVKMIQDKKSDCVIDISELSALDLAGINALALAHKTVSGYGRELTILSSTDNPADEFLHLTKFKSVFNLRRS